MSIGQSFQLRAWAWLLHTFKDPASFEKGERTHRFLEESLELAQALHCTKEEAHQLVEYVYGRPVGEVSQEVGGVMTTLAVLCHANLVDLNTAAETELQRCWSRVDEIRKKQAGKPKLSPLPQ